jgi:hypothetical protein
VGLLVERDQRQQNPPSLALSGEQHAIDHAIAVGSDLEQVATQVPRRLHSVTTNLFHRSENRRLIHARSSSARREGRAYL